MELSRLLLIQLMILRSIERLFIYIISEKTSLLNTMRLCLIF